MFIIFFFFFSSRRRHTRFSRDWSSDVCSSDLGDVNSGVLRVPTATIFPSRWSASALACALSFEPNEVVTLPFLPKLGSSEPERACCAWAEPIASAIEPARAAERRRRALIHYE